jgi:hypothetical protein
MLTSLLLDIAISLASSSEGFSGVGIFDRRDDFMTGWQDVAVTQQM